MVFLDVSKALDSVKTELLLNTMAKQKIPSKIIEWIYTYLKGRTLILKTEQEDVEIKVNQGLPQGCPLSPILFNLYTTSLHNDNEED